MTFKGQVICDYVGKLEILDDLVDVLKERCGVNLAIGVKNKRSQSKSEYVANYNENLLQKVYGRYADDVIMFKYSLDEEKKKLEGIN